MSYNVNNNVATAGNPTAMPQQQQQQHQLYQSIHEPMPLAASDYIRQEIITPSSWMKFWTDLQQALHSRLFGVRRWLYSPIVNLGIAVLGLGVTYWSSKSKVEHVTWSNSTRASVSVETSAMMPVGCGMILYGGGQWMRGEPESMKKWRAVQAICNKAINDLPVFKKVTDYDKVKTNDKHIGFFAEVLAILNLQELEQLLGAKSSVYLSIRQAHDALLQQGEREAKQHALEKASTRGEAPEERFNLFSTSVFLNAHHPDYYRQQQQYMANSHLYPLNLE